MLTLDGAQGEGGGQILRSALALSMVTGTPFRMTNVRANRPKPGLMRQHLTAVEAAQAVCGAKVEGGAIGSVELVFEPGRVRPGDYAFAVGTAGSTTLVLQTILPALLLADGPSTITLEGGTHNPLSPPFEFLERTYLPTVARMGPRVEAMLERRGFYPAGGGKVRVAVTPSPVLSRLELHDRGEVAATRGTAIVSALPVSIAEREVRTLAGRLRWNMDCFHTEEVQRALGPGNVVLLEIECAGITEVFTGFGKKGVSAEQVANEVAAEAAAYLDSTVPVGRHLADQLLLLMALGEGGSFRTLEPTPHTRSQIVLLESFLDVPVEVRAVANGEWEIRVG